MPQDSTINATPEKFGNAVTVTTSIGELKSDSELEELDDEVLISHDVPLFAKD
jgi:hypothetical protein